MNNIQVASKNVLEVADSLFQMEGYDSTTLADIAEHADIPVEILERDYGRKVQIALAIYNQLSEQSHEQAKDIAAAPIHQMYYALLEQRLSLLADHSEVSSILFSTAMRPDATITAAQIAPGLRDPMMKTMQDILDRANDTSGKKTDDMMFFLYAFHFLTIVFWLYDRTDDKAASHMFTGFLRDLLKMLKPLMVLPLLSKALTHMAKIMMVVFGGARIVDRESK